LAGTIIADYIRTDANQLSLNVGNTTFATINAGGFYSNTGVQIISPTGAINAASIAAGSIPVGKLGAASVSRTNMYSGAVLQVVNVITSTESTTTSTAFQASNLAATITPTSTTSKILIICNSPLYGPGDNFHIYTTIARNGTNVSSNELQLFSTGPATGGRWSNGSMTWYDSPSSTSALTYTVYFRSLTNGQAVYYMTNGQRAIMTLMEIAG
jgi:hypothetical protein